AVAAEDNTPADNPITNAGAELGRVLFYDTRLSHNDSTSCASCHQQSAGFSDPAPLSEGFEGELTGRKSMGLSNAKFYASGEFFWDERSPTLEHQVLQPIQSPVEMGVTSLSDLEDKLSQTEFYPQLFQRAFGSPEVTSERMSAAMAQFVRSMVSYQSKFDQAFEGQGPPDFVGTLTASEESGHQIFAARCDGCHRTNAQVADDTHNIGLDLESSEEAGTDEGAGNGEFKPPSLRNVAVRGSFMHDGRFSSLEEVVQFYSTGIQANPNLDDRLTNARGLPVRFNFTNQEMQDLVAFLNSLTDESFLTNELFSNPFVVLDGDYNGDGVVDTDDYIVWRDNFGSLENLAADGNLDGVVDSADYSVWRDNLGASWSFLADASIEAAAAPEPVALVMLGVLLAWRTVTNRPRRRSG
ncbi:MAG: c-type cytochrome, partial [Planctomycetales bacterium]|nr:c-type cytochrome [Planctomycetales bacterium]